MSPTSTLLPWQLDGLTSTQLAAVSYLARYSGPTHALYAYQLRRWFGWCESNGLDPLTGVQRAHVELYIRGLAESGLRDSSICTMMHGVAGSSGSRTSTASSPPTRRSTSGCRSCNPTRPPPRASTGSS